MKALLLLPLPFLLAAAQAAEEEALTADLQKLADPAQREAEVARLAECDGKEKTLAKFRLHDAPQKDGEPLKVLAVESDYHFKSNSPPLPPDREYVIEKPAELFGPEFSVPRELFVPGLSMIDSATLRIFDSSGKVLDLFDEDDYLRRGFLYDFNRDGILERADVMEESVKGLDWQQIDVFTLRTIERQPRTLLRVLFNWHSRLTSEPNVWQVTCFDDNGDGIVEVGFGPLRAASDAGQRRFIFRWDPARQAYSAGDIPAGAHLRVLTADESLQPLVKEGGLGYAVPKDGEQPAPKQAPRPAAAAAPYVFRSLKDADDAAMLAFFQGKPHRDSFSGPEDGVPNQAPAGFWSMTPKQAALALADANRTPSHRYRWKLVIDDRNGAAPPASGWWVYDWDSSGCYTSSSHLFALRFGKEKSWLLTTAANSSGVVGANPLADEPGHSARVIALDQKEAAFLGETLYWLDRVRSHEIGSAPQDRWSRSSSADGSARLHLIPDGKPALELADRVVWATGSISENWDQEYAPVICLNLAEHLFDQMLPAWLGERWQVAPDVKARGLSTPLKERLTPRLDDSARKQLAAQLREAFTRNAADPIPALAVTGLVQCIGDEALTELRPDLERLQASLPAKGAEDKEYEALAARFQFDHFGNAERDDPDKHPKDYARFQELIEKRQFKNGPMLRRPLQVALQKLDLASSAKRLKKEADGNGELAAWALGRLRKGFPEAWQDHLVLGFREQGAEEQANIFDTLSAASPQSGKNLIDLMTPKQVSNLLVEIAGFEAEHDPERAKERVPALIGIVRDKKADYRRRGQAMHALAAIPLTEAQLAEVTALLLAEIRAPQTDKSPLGMSTLSDAVEALSRLPGAAMHLDTLQAASAGGIFGFESGLDVLARLSVGLPDRQARLESYLRPCLENHHGMMYEVFFAALAFDLKGLAPGIAAYATEGPGVPDGAGSHSAGGSFKGPAGERYHPAREVASLWAETDPDTLARMWIAFTASHAYHMTETSRRGATVARALREKAATAIRAMPAAARKPCIARTVALLPEDWARREAEQLFNEILPRVEGP